MTEHRTASLSEWRLGVIDEQLARGVASRWRGIGRAAALSLVSTSAGLLLAKLGGSVIDLASPHGPRRTLLTLAVAVSVVGLHLAFAGWLRARTLLALQASLEADLLTRLARSVAHARSSAVSSPGQGKLLETLDATAGAAHLAIAAVANGFTLGVSTLLHVAALFYFDYRFAAGTLALLGTVLLMACALTARQNRLAARSTTASATQRRELVFGLQSLATARMLGVATLLRASWLKALRSDVVGQARQQQSQSDLDLLLHSAKSAALVATLSWLGWLCLSHQASVGSLLFVVNLMTGLCEASFELLASWSQLIAHRPRLAHANELLAAARPSVEETSRNAGHLAADRLCVRYAGGPWVLENFSLEVRPGEIVVLEGSSGAGKSTLLRIIAGTLTPDRGFATVDGLSCEERGGVVYVPQHAKLPEGTLGQILLLLSGADHDTVERVAGQTGLAGFVSQLPLGWETPILAGSNISAGQAQLILVTAAFASARRVVLLDEALRHISSDYLERFAWQHLAEKRSVVLVEHRLTERKLCPPGARFVPLRPERSDRP